MKTKHIPAFVVGLIISSFLAVARADEPKPLRVGVSPMSPPIQYMEGNSVVGLEVDFAEALGKELGRPVELVNLKFRELIPNLLASEIDIIMSGMSITHIRSLQVAYAEPYLKIGQVALVRAEDKNQFNFSADIIMTTKNIGTIENTTGEYLVVQEFPKAKKYFFSNPLKGATALKKKKIDLFILDSPYVAWLAVKNEGKLVPLPFMLTEENLAWAVRKSDKDLLDQVNGVLNKWKETGQLEDMIKKWIPGFN